MKPVALYKIAGGGTELAYHRFYERAVHLAVTVQFQYDVRFKLEGGTESANHSASHPKVLPVVYRMDARVSYRGRIYQLSCLIR